MPGSLERLAEHLAWADRAARESIATLDADTPEHDEVRRLYAHIAASEHIWVARIRGLPNPYPVWPDLTIESAVELTEEAAEAILELVRSVDAGGLEREVRYSNSSGREFTQRVEDILFHVLLHGAYHRGQIAQLVRKGGGAPASTDYIAFLRGVPAPSVKPPPSTSPIPPADPHT